MAMGRGYDRSGYVERVRSVTDRLPNCGLGADVIVGFPGETEGDFEDTVDVVESLPFTYLHVFSYSPRAGTPAAEFEGQVPGLVKRRRSLRLRELSRERSLAFRRSLVGHSVRVLFEDREQVEPGTATGLSESYVRITVNGGAKLANRLRDVKVTSADSESTRGRVVGPAETEGGS